MDLEHLDDQALMEAYKQGEVRAFETLLHRHERVLYGFLVRQTGDRDAARDLLQEVFLRVIRGAERYRPEAKWTTWLYRIARNLLIDHRRRGKHRRMQSLDQPVGSEGERPTTLGDRIANGNPGVERQVMGRELQIRLETALAQLSEEQREVFLMRETMQLPFGEIATIVGCSENTVKSRMRYALEKLRQGLADLHDHGRVAAS